jgi:acyl carrier protein
MQSTEADGRFTQLSAERRLLLERIRAGRVSADDPGPLPRAPDQADLPLTYEQEQMWLLDRMGGPGALSSAPLCARLEGPLDEVALAAAVTQLIVRHEVLRTTVRVVSGNPRQVISEAARADVQLVDVGSEAAARSAISAELGTGIDITTGPMLRIRAYRIADDQYVLCIVRHHITSDARSDEIFTAELSALYRAALDGETADLPALPVQYADIALWQRQRLAGPRRDDLLAYWLEKLAEPPPLPVLPTSWPAAQSRRGSSRFVSRRLPGDLAARLEVLAQAEQVTPLIVVLAVLRVLLWRHVGQRDVLIGTPVSVRDRPQTQNLIGFFLNMVVLRGDLSGDPGVRELIQRERDVVLGAFDRRDLPYALLSQALNRSVVNPLCTIRCSYHVSEPGAGGTMLGLPAAPFDAAMQNSDSNLEVRVSRDDEGVTAEWAFNDEILARSTVEEIADRYVDCLSAAVSAPETPMSALPAWRRDWAPAVSLAVEFTPGPEGWLTPDGRLPFGVDLQARDDHGVPVPIGAVGRLHIGEPGVSRYEGVPVRLLPTGVLRVHGHVHTNDQILEDGNRVASVSDRESSDPDGNSPLVPAITEIWRELLAVEPSNADVSLFTIGGHSLTIAQIGMRIEEEFGVSVPIAKLFERPTIAAQARLVHAAIVERLTCLSSDPGATAFE